MSIKNRTQSIRLCLDFLCACLRGDINSVRNVLTNSSRANIPTNSSRAAIARSSRRTRVMNSRKVSICRRALCGLSGNARARNLALYTRTCTYKTSDVFGFECVCVCVSVEPHQLSAHIALTLREVST